MNVIYKTFDFIISLGVLILIKYFEADNEETKCCNYFTQNKISTFSKRITKQIFCYLFIYLFYFGKCFFFFSSSQTCFPFWKPQKIVFFFSFLFKNKKTKSITKYELSFSINFPMYFLMQKGQGKKNKG